MTTNPAARDDRDEAAAARHRSLEKLEQALHRGHEVTQVASILKRRRETNHFSEQITEAMNRRRQTP